MRERKQRFPRQMGHRRATDGDVRDVGAPNARLGEHRANGHRREPGPVLDAPKTLLLDGGEQDAIAEQHRRDIAVVRIDSKDIHELTSWRAGKGARWQPHT
jgi:hypothetical protein